MPRDTRPPGGAPASATCASCRAPFEYDATFYADRGIHPPSRCRSCRQERAERLVPKVGEVVRVGPDFAVIEVMGSKFISFGVADLGLAVGEKVRFGVDPGAPVPGGGLAVAKQVRRLG